jgi:hypothetical protein
VYFYDGGDPKLEIGYTVYSLDDSLIHAARKGNLGLTGLCKELGDINNRKLDEAMAVAVAAAAGGGHEALVRLCHDEWHASNVNTAMAAAAGGGYEALVRLCHDDWVPILWI